MSLKAYQAAQAATEDPRVTEYRLFGQVTGALLNGGVGIVAGAAVLAVVSGLSKLWRVMRPAQ